MIDPGADLGFYLRGVGGGGADFRKSFEKICRPFFKQSTQNTSRPCFGQTLCAAGKILKKQTRKAFLVVGTFWKTLTKKPRFFGARSPFKISIF